MIQTLIEYYSLDYLDRLLELFLGKKPFPALSAFHLTFH